MIAARAVVVYALRESVRRRVFTVVLVLTALFLVLYGLGAFAAFDAVDDFTGGENNSERADTGAVLLGFAMFVILFLSAVLAIFLTLGAVRGEAERGLLQPVAVRPISRTMYLAARFTAAVVAAGGYAFLFYVATVAVTGVAGGWWPDQPLTPGLALAAAAAVIAGLSLLGSVFLSSTANGIAVFMLFGTGLTSVILREVGDALDSSGVERLAEAITWLLPFQALYLAGLESVGEEAGDVASLLGAFGSEGSGPVLLVAWTVAYLLFTWAVARAGFARRDL